MKKSELIVWHTEEPPHNEREHQYMVVTDWRKARSPYASPYRKLEQMYFIYDPFAGCWHWENTKNQRIVAWAMLPSFPFGLQLEETDDE